MEQDRQKEHAPVLDTSGKGRQQGEFPLSFPLPEFLQLFDTEEGMNVDRIDVIEVVLHLAADLLELGDVAVEKPEVVHQAERLGNPFLSREDRAKGVVDLPVPSKAIVYEGETLADQGLDRKTQVCPLPLGMFKEGVPGPLCLRHPLHCQTLFDAAGAAGAKTLRGVTVIETAAGDDPHVTYEKDGETHTAHARLLVGADGRTSQVREAAGIVLHQDKPHHWFAGLLVDGVEGWSDDLQAIGTEGDFGFLAFPQGDGKVRVYGGYALDQAQRFKGPEGPRRFLDAFAMNCSPQNRHLVAGTPAGPLFSYFNADAWTDEPFAKGVVLVGDAGGWNDPIQGLGLSITYRDVRMVSELLKSTDDWANLSFASYGDERRERLRRLRFTAKIQSALDMEFGEEAAARRKSLHERAAVDPSLKIHAFAVMAGPETLPPEVFTEEHRARVLGA
jgi:2-polyprenyl-6-methoxyphenol hydroxylase-like FAD-dependent oxidoreductase